MLNVLAASKEMPPAERTGPCSAASVCAFASASGTRHQGPSGTLQGRQGSGWAPVAAGHSPSTTRAVPWGVGVQYPEMEALQRES